MKCIVRIDSSLVNKKDITFLNYQSKDVQFTSIESKNFFPSEVTFILIDLPRNIGYNSAYDMLKYTILKIMSLLINKKEKNTDLQFEISCNGKLFSIKGKNALTEKQMDKLVDAAVEVLLSEWSCKENTDEKQ